jgi:hypothetical protein
MNSSKTGIRYPRLHRDGTVSFWSYHRQEWVQHAFHVPIEDLQAMEPYDRKRVQRHLGYESLERVDKAG